MNDILNINSLAWESGTYSIQSNKLTLTINKSCVPAEMHETGGVVEFSIDSDALTLTDGSVSLKYTKIESTPSIPKNVEYGYGGDKGWVAVKSCSSPYN